MNTEQAKNLSLPKLLENLGHLPVKNTKGGRELWYPSPFRKEKDPSFHASIGRSGFWIWNDFGDSGGTVIDFAMRYGNYTSVRDALAFLDRHHSGQGNVSQSGSGTLDLFSFHQQDHREAVENFSADRQLEFVDAYPIRNPAILSYLAHERSIPAELAKRYLVEVKYNNLAVGKQFFGFGMLNESGGYEVRVALRQHKFKSAINARDITVIEGSDTDSQEVSIFEGMTDFLSFLVMQGKAQIPGKTIVMHSLSSHGRTVEYLQSHPSQVIKTYLDNNVPGQKGTEKLKVELGQGVTSFSATFAPYVDLNDALVAMRSRSSGASFS